MSAHESAAGIVFVRSLGAELKAAVEITGFHSYVTALRSALSSSLHVAIAVQR